MQATAGDGLDMHLYHIARRVFLTSFFMALFAFTVDAQFQPAFGSGDSGTVRGTVQNAGIGNRLSREQLLESLVEPSARLAPGFGTVRITLKDNQVVTGILMEESATELILRTSDAEPLEIAVSRISKRENLPSSMPPMGTLLSKRDIRDVIEFLANLKDGSGG